MSDTAGDRAAGAGWRLRLDATARRTDGGRVLVGGTPLRVLRLSDAGRTWLDRVAAGDPVPPGAASTALARRLVDGALAHPLPPAGAGPRPDEVAVVVPVRDDAGGLARTLAGAEGTAAVVVVDDGSRDPLAVPRAVGDEGTVLRHERPLGPGAARETGWRATDAAFVAFVDADVGTGPGWLDRLLPHLADPAVGAVAPRVRAHGGRAPGWLARYEQARSPLDLGPDPAAVRPGTRVPYVPTAALVVRRAALESIGGFDAALLAGEDVDLVWRLHEAGWRVRYEPAAEVDHPVRPDVRSWLAQRFTYGTSAAPLAERHGDAVAPLRGVSGWSAAAWAAVVLGRPLPGVALAAATTAALTPKLSAMAHPAREALRIAGLGNLWAGRSVADALRRPWWPFALALGVASRRSRPALAAAALVPPALEWRARRPPLDPVRYAALRLADDLAYGAGVWAGCLRHRSLRALRPAFRGGDVAVEGNLEPTAVPRGAAP